jgi:4-amino-4-deoxy-L-arabinose transferase-like glycosyltransferase
VRRPMASRWGLPLVLAVYLPLALSFSFIIPLGESADEVSHYSYIAEIRQNGRLPAPEGPAIGEAHQPPLYYALAVLLTAWVPDGIRPVQANPEFSFDGASAPNLLLHPRAEAFPFTDGAALWHLLRAISVLMGAITVWATFALAREIFPRQPSVALVAAASLALLPSFVIISAVVNNDNLVITLCTLGLLCWARVVKRPPELALGHGVMLGVLLGLAALAKLPGLLLWPVIAVGYALLGLDASTRRAWFKVALLTLASALAVYSPWLIFNAVAYDDPLAWSRFLRVTPRTGAMTLPDAWRYAESMLTSIVGRYGGASQIRLPGATYATAAVLGLAGIAGSLTALRSWRSGASGRPRKLILVACGLFGGLLVAAHVRLMTFILGMDQARHVFSGLPPLIIVLAWGWQRLVKGKSWPQALVVGALAAVSVAALWSAAATYTQAPQAVAALLPSGPGVAEGAFGDSIRLIQASVEPVRVAAGATVTVTTGWRAEGTPSREYWLQVQLTDLAGGPDALSLRDGVPAFGRVTTDLWQAGQIWPSVQALTVPAGTTPGRYQVRIGLHPFGRWEWLPVAGGQLLKLAEVEVTAAP